MMRYRHFVDVLRRSEGTDSRGQSLKGYTVLMKDVPCSIDTLSGREAEVAHRLVGTATHQVEMRGPIAGLSPECKLGEHPKNGDGTYKSYLAIGHVNDPTRTGRDYTLLVTEVVS